MDIVFINGLRVSSCIGVYDWEKRIRQTLIFNIEMAWDNKPAATTDDIELALDYSQVSSQITEFAESRQFELIETMAEQVCQLVMDKFSVKWIALSLLKPGAVPNAETVGVRIERGSKA